MDSPPSAVFELSFLLLAGAIGELADAAGVDICLFCSESLNEEGWLFLKDDRRRRRPREVSSLLLLFGSSSSGGVEVDRSSVEDDRIVIGCVREMHSLTYPTALRVTAATRSVTRCLCLPASLR